MALIRIPVTRPPEPRRIPVQPGGGETELQGQTRTDQQAQTAQTDGRQSQQPAPAGR